MKRHSLILLSLIALTNLLIADTASNEKAIKSIELNISILQEQYDNSVSELKRAKEELPRKLGVYEGTLVGRYQLEDQIRKQQAKLYTLKTGKETDPSLPPEISVANASPLKLLITLHSTDPEVDGTDYFTFQEMEIHFPVKDVTWLQISDFGEDNIYPIYKVDEIRSDKKLVLKLEGYTYEL